MRKMNDFATGFGVLAILLPFIITIILTSVSYTVGVKSEALSGLELYIPSNYKNMSAPQRIDYLNTLHGGAPTKVNVGLDPGNIWTLWQAYEYHFPDGTSMTDDQYLKFVYGDATQINFIAVTLACLTMNPPLLHHIGVWGMLIRIILVISVAIGLADLIIPG